VPTPYPVPYGGTSLPAVFTVPFGPDTGFTLSINFLTAYPGISLSTNVIDWEAGFTQVEVWIYSSNDTKVTGGSIVSGGTLVLSLTGVNQNIFTLSQSTMDFFVGSAMILPSSITSITVTNILMNSATVTVAVGDYCMLYYMLALDRTITPNLTEVLG
jgi:hypothetical protein